MNIIRSINDYIYNNSDYDYYDDFGQRGSDKYITIKKHTIPKKDPKLIKLESDAAELLSKMSEIESILYDLSDLSQETNIYGNTNYGITAEFHINGINVENGLLINDTVSTIFTSILEIKGRLNDIINSIINVSYDTDILYIYINKA